MLNERRKACVRRLLMLVTVVMCGAMGATLVVQNANPDGFSQPSTMPQPRVQGQN